MKEHEAGIMTIERQNLSSEAASRTLIPNIEKKYADALEQLIDLDTSAEEYRAAMKLLGHGLGELLSSYKNNEAPFFLVSTAEDTDYLAQGVAETLANHHLESKRVVFWNNHYQLPTNNQSIAPIVHSFYEQGYEQAKTMIVVKSVISGSCVVRTNINALFEKINPKKVYIVSPVMHIDAEKKLCEEFPDNVSSTFNFIYFALDKIKQEDGEVVPGIGGQVYQRLGISDQPVKTGYMPIFVKNAILNSLYNT